jgi:hypothetical protein
VTIKTPVSARKPTIYDDSKIYVLCPSRIVTGGIEAVHQLVDKLRRFGHAGFIVPVPAVSNPALLQYRNYNVAFASAIVDDPRNLLITTEVNPKALDQYHFIQKAIWWLSVDFHEALQETFDFEHPQSHGVTHFVQSAYAASFLRGKGISRMYSLTDYLHAEYLKTFRRRRKSDIVLYTPVKGAQYYIDRLIAADDSIQWLALSGMIRKKHAHVMRDGKVYVDFGRHPGKDRQPREAAVNGCCVIVGRAGAACFEEDIPILDGYKFDLQTLDDRRILDTIRSCLTNYETRKGDFAGYAAIVRGDEKRFEEEVKACFGVKSKQKKWSGWVAVVNTLRFAKQNTCITVFRGFVNEFMPLQFSDFSRSLYRAQAEKRSKRQP